MEKYTWLDSNRLLGSVNPTKVSSTPAGPPDWPLAVILHWVETWSFVHAIALDMSPVVRQSRSTSIRSGVAG
jgi:hypothetical protein